MYCCSDLISATALWRIFLIRFKHFVAAETLTGNKMLKQLIKQ